MLLLAFDTATPAVTAALHDGERILAESTTVDPRRHGELLLPAIDRVLRLAGRTRAELTAVVVGTGPGPYTGLRVGLVTAAALSDALDLSVYGLCTLDGMAHAALGAGMSGPFVVATDARRKEVYWARYDEPKANGPGRAAGLLPTGATEYAPTLRLDGPAVDRPAEMPEEIAVLPSVGAGATLYRDDARNGWGTNAVGAEDGMPQRQSAAALADLAAGMLRTSGAQHPGFLQPLPLYLRRPHARVPTGYKGVLP